MSNGNDWSRIRALLDRVLDAEPADWAALLAAEPDSEIRTAVEAMLALRERSGVLDAGALALVPAAPDAESTAPVTPPSVGAWRPLRLLGRGGMGEVWLAERADGQFSQQAALKLVHAGLLNPELTRRFLRERAILAGLRHPGIATLLDGGVSETGQPWFTLEWIDGVPITDWCRAQQLSAFARIRLFLKVLEAVGYAHRNLIVHRDIKPGNVLVDQHGPKLLDFGIAKLLDEQSDSSTLPHANAFTPGYAAPEQIEGSRISTATDVFALGALLFEMLTEQRARPRGVGIEWQGPPPMGNALAQPAAPDYAAAERRSLQDGRLDRILHTALARDPLTRHASVDALAADLEDVLAGRPLRDQPIAWSLRARLWLHRQRKALAAAGVVGLVLALSGFSLWQRQQAELQRIQQSANVRKLLMSVLAGADPELVAEQPPSVRELLDTGRERVLRDLPADDPARPLLLTDLAEIYFNLGEYDSAAALLNTAMPALSADAEQARALKLRAMTGRELGAFSAAASDAANALKRLPAGSVDWIDTSAVLASVQRKQDLLPAAEATLTAALKAFAALPLAAQSRRQAADLYHGLGRLYDELGRYPEALTALDQAVSQLSGTTTPALGRIQVDQAMLLNRLGRGDEALPIFDAAIAAHERALGPLHPWTLGAREERALALLGLRRTGESVQAFRELLVDWAKVPGDHADALAFTRHNYSTVAYAAGDFAEAASYARLVLADLEPRLGLQHERTIIARTVLGASLLEVGDAKAAQPILEGAVAAARARGTPDNLPGVLNSLALVYLAERDGERAQALLREGIRVQEQLFPDDPRQTLWGRVLLARADFVSGRVQSALKQQEALLLEYRQAWPNPGLRTAELMIDVAGSLRALQREPERAQQLLADARAIKVAQLGAQHPAVIRIDALLKR